MAAIGDQSRDAELALEQLCGKYWYPLYAFLRRQGRRPEDAKDLTQGFFAHLLVNDRLQNLHPAKGKFRSFLLACLNNYVQNVRDKEQAEKRGGRQIVIPIDLADAEEHYGYEPADVQDPSRIFERRWASTVIEHVLQQLKENCIKSGKAQLFETLLPFLTGEAERGDYIQPAAKLHKNENTVRQEVHRLRGEFRELLRAEVGRTVDSPAEIDGEIRYLFNVFQES